MIRLGDDGTMDTVLVCDGCGEEMRYNFNHEDDCDEAGCYDQFVDWALEDAQENHECEKMPETQEDIKQELSRFVA